MERKPTAKVKITVLKTLFFEDLANAYIIPERQEGYRYCKRHQVGQEYIIDSFDKPADFCSWAWADIHREIIALMHNAEYSKSTDTGSVIVCCTDGIRPVIFKVERIA